MVTGGRKNLGLAHEPGLLAFTPGKDIVDSTERGGVVPPRQFHFDGQLLQRDQGPDGSHSIVQSLHGPGQVRSSRCPVRLGPGEKVIGYGRWLHGDRQVVLAGSLEVAALPGQGLRERSAARRGVGVSLEKAA